MFKIKKKVLILVVRTGGLYQSPSLRMLPKNLLLRSSTHEHDITNKSGSLKISCDLRKKLSQPTSGSLHIVCRALLLEHCWNGIASCIVNHEMPRLLRIHVRAEPIGKLTVT